LLAYNTQRATRFSRQQGDIDKHQDKAALARDQDNKVAPANLKIKAASTKGTRPSICNKKETYDWLEKTLRVSDIMRLEKVSPWWQ
jgi:hypothetical protein